MQRTPAKPIPACRAIGILLLFLMLACGHKPEPKPPAGKAGPTSQGSAPGSPQLLATGKTLYTKHCAACHGDKGDGAGPAAYLLYPKPRNFASLDFRLISTANSFPSDDDLYRSISRGMPGSAMPPWEHLAEQDRRALVQWVKHLTVEARVASFVVSGLSESEARALAAQQCVAGKAVVIPPETPPTPAALERGKTVYKEHCVACHDQDGRGRLKRDLVDSLGYPIFARDFTAGIFKGDGAGRELATRFVAGMPGTPMPSFTDKFAPDDDLWALVHYLRSMVPEGAQENVRQRRRDLVARRAQVPVGAEPSSDAWNGTPATRLALTPLWWRDDRIEAVFVQAAHDGQRVAVRLTWEDATENDHQIGQRAFADGAAIQLSNDPDPPFFAMGAKGAAVNLWHWKATWQGDAAGFRDVQHSFPNAVSDVYPSLKSPPFGRHSEVGEFRVAEHKPLFLSGWGAGNSISNPERKMPVEDLTAEGFGTLTTRGKANSLTGGARWANGKWQAVFVRSLAADGAGTFAFVPGATASIAFAVWDGASGDRNGQKSVTIWHRLTLEK